ncbi:hypothetical protein AgCh_032944 [Apium graveolens]
MVLQLNGVIARCSELDVEPTLNFFFSLYRLKSTGAQVYFDVKPGRPKLVSTPSSNSVAGPKLRLLVNSRIKMPSESFLKLLAKKKVGAGVSGIENVVGNEKESEKSPVEVGGDELLAVLEVVAKDSKLDAAMKEKKRHRDHSSSRSHHHKKHKDALKVVVLEDSDLASLGLAVLRKTGLGGEGGVPGGKIVTKEREFFLMKASRVLRLREDWDLIFSQLAEIML